LDSMHKPLCIQVRQTIRYKGGNTATGRKCMYVYNLAVREDTKSGGITNGAPTACDRCIH